MIKIVITKETRNKYTVKENVVAKETPTEHQEDGYGGRKQIVPIKEYAVQDVEKVETKTITLLEQNIEDDASVDIPAIVAVINKINGAH